MPPPAANGTITLMVLSGKPDCAAADAIAQTKTMAMAMKRANMRRPTTTLHHELAAQVFVDVHADDLVECGFCLKTERNRPLRVEALSRFRPQAEQREVLAGLADGRVDVVIGTHRLLTTNVRFKDLGLVVIDEEQRFGVEHKEHLKALRTNVDMLAMSATPIPRTLAMAHYADLEV